MGDNISNPDYPKQDRLVDRMECSEVSIPGKKAIEVCPASIKVNHEPYHPSKHFDFWWSADDLEGEEVKSEVV